MVKSFASTEKMHTAHVCWFPKADSGTAFLALFHNVTEVCPTPGVCGVSSFSGVLFIGDDYHELAEDEVGSQFTAPAMKRWIRNVVSGETGSEECHVCLESLDDRVADSDGTGSMIAASRLVACSGCSVWVCMGCWKLLEKCPLCPTAAPRETFAAW